MLCVLHLFGVAQNATVTGTVTGNNNSLAGASVSVKPTGKGTIVNTDGKYSLLLPAGTYSISFSYAGFETKTESVTLKEGEEKVLDIVLNSDSRILQDVIVVGSRSLPRSSASTPLPVDNLDYGTLKATGQPTFDKTLQYRVPSFNVINTPVNDATTLLDPYEIRNLGPSRTLILINGKRKNLSSLLYVQFAPGRGETGADISGIPVDAIKRVEILRDGASAQYGSDAIAGVMNIILKDNYQFSSLTLNSGVTSKGDGGMYGIAFNGGSSISKKGFINYTVDFSQQNNAVRSGIIDRPTEKATFGGTPAANAAIDAYLNRFPTGNNTNGTGEISAAKFNYNMGIPFGESAQIYSNAGLVVKKAISNANFRTPYWRTDAGLLHRQIPGQPNYTGGTDPLYQGYLGYEPTFEGDLLDYHGTLGVKNETNGWKHDAAFTFGGNQQLYSVENTVNRSLGANSPTSFKPGGFRFSHVVGNYDVSKALSDNFSIAFGTEVRSETYRIIAGDTASYSGEGSNSFPGFREDNARSNNRFNIGAYVDASWDITNDFLINAAVRGEKYSDFGEALVWKASSRYKFADDKVILRGSVSTGFRAPTLHQIYSQSTQASFNGGTIVLSGLFNNRSKQAFALQVPLLKPERSTNYTAGIGFNPTSKFSITLDYYNIAIKERIVYSSSINSDDKLLAVPTTELGRILKGSATGTGNFELASVQFFINGIKTRTQGLDFVASYRGISLGGGKLGVNLAGNYTLENEIIGNPTIPKPIKDAGGDILNEQIRSLLTRGRPLYKGVLGFDWARGKFFTNLNNTLFGTTEFQDLDNGGAAMKNIKQEFIPAVVTDLQLGYNFTDKISASVNINNLLNVLPKWELKALNAAGEAVLKDPVEKNLLEGFLAFSGRYRILGYNGSQFSQLGTIFQASLSFKF
jgi:iron complex outermembrane receptor protein